MNASSDDAMDEPHIHAQIARLARAVHGSSDAQVMPDTVLRHVTESAVELLPGVNHAGVTLVRKRYRNAPPDLESTAETGPIPLTFDQLQHDYGEGPCFEAIWSHQSFLIDDIDHEDRWPSLIRAVREQTPIRSTLSLQLFVDDLELGALNLHSETAHAFDEDVESLATTLATHAAIALSTARRGRQFRSALASRDIIGQAKGMIMERYGFDAVRAFDILRRLSQESNTPLTEVAAQLVDADHPFPRLPEPKSP